MRIANANNHSYSSRTRQPLHRRGRNMSTLTTPPLSKLLTQLFQAAAHSSSVLEQMSTNMSAEDRTRLMTGAPDYRQMCERMEDFHLAVSPATGTLLYMLARAAKTHTKEKNSTSFD